MAERDPLPPIKFEALADALLARVDQLLSAWLPGGVQRGHEYVCGSLSGGSGTSCSINVTTGRWADFAADEKGNDLISLYAAIHGLTMGKAAVTVAREEGLEDVAGVQPAPAGSSGEPPAPRPVRPPEPPKPVKTDEGWATVVPVPANAPGPTFTHYHRKAEDITHTATYMRDGELLGYVVRFQTSDGGKDTLPHTWCTSARSATSRWHWRQWDAPRPLFLPGGATPVLTQTVILVEGEKKAEVLHALLDVNSPGVYAVVSWAGGCKAWDKAQWSLIAGRHVLLWPDCDGKRVPLTKAERDQRIARTEKELDHPHLRAMSEQDRQACFKVALDMAASEKPLLPVDKQPGMKAMLGIGAQLRDEHGCTVQLLPIPEPLTVADGWDCADAILTDGWTADNVMAFLCRAQPLPGVQEATTAKEDGAKKRDGLADTGDGDDAAPDGFVKIGSRDIPQWLSFYYDRDKKRWNTSRKMVIQLLERDPLLEPVLAYNELSNNVQSRILWPWPHSKVGDVTDAVDLLLGDYLTDAYGLPSISRAALAEAIQTVAHKRRFHPIRERLESLKWDGTSRIDKWLTHVLGERPVAVNGLLPTLKTDMAEYLQIVGRCWLLGMVNRVMQPGCKFDYCPVLEGIGGLRKSTMVEILAGSEYFSDTPFEVGRGKEAQEQVQGLWLYEIAEMTHFSKAEVGAIKAFITSKVDRYRVAYGSTVGSFARQCVLVGTTNENTYLRDRTGNRRFWPIPVRHVINTEWLTKYRDQLMAEAYALYKQGVPYTPTPDQERRLFQPMQESRLVETAVLSELLYVLTRDCMPTGIASVVNGLTDFVTIAQLTLALGVDAAKSSPALEAQIRGWLDHEGWERCKRQINGARAWGYTRPANWPATGTEEEMTDAPEIAPPDMPDESNEQDGDDAPF